MQALTNPTLPAVLKRRLIDAVEISNFKFFPALGADNKSIKIDGKHLLIYGENGSGKSSLYWALYTLLECANKPNQTDIEKYFEYDGEESLLNINAPQQAAPNERKAENAYVKISLKDDANNDYLISYDDVAIRTKLEPQISNFASDFINYRVLYSAFNYSHSEEVDLYLHFKYTVFPYVKFDDPCKIWIKNEGTGNWDEVIIQRQTQSCNFLEHGAFTKCR
ncbi:MAG: AAA family ATPase [Bacteroidetes bacterium]|nr:AAA family ATPase [Bacteroidota bacterium]